MREVDAHQSAIRHGGRGALFVTQYVSTGCVCAHFMYILLFPFATSVLSNLFLGADFSVYSLHQCCLSLKQVHKHYRDMAL